MVSETQRTGLRSLNDLLLHLPTITPPTPAASASAPSPTTDEDDPEPSTWPSPDDVILPDEFEAELIDATLREARAKLYHAARANLHRWRIRQQDRGLRLLLADNLRADVIRRGQQRQIDGRFNLSGYYGDLLTVLCYYFTGDGRFTESVDEFAAPVFLEKGILLRGPVGCRKTSLLRLLAGNPRAPFELVTAEQIVADFRQYGQPGLDYWIARPTLLIDDFGAEPTEAANYGNRTSPALDVLKARDDAQQRGRLSRGATHLTTNLSAAEIAARYGDRIASRCREMFNAFAFPADAPDYRR